MILTAKQLVDVVAMSGAGSVAIVGTAKNVGKTVTMNYLISELSSRGVSVGLVSSGRDGEAIDAFTGEPKPSVVVPSGAWVATAEGVLGESATCLEIADVLDWPGLFGRLVVGKTVDPAALELVGPRSARELSALVSKLLAFGAGIVLVDGALDRMAAASPRVTDATILATGAAADSNLDTMAQQLGFLVWLLSRPEHDSKDVACLAREAMSKDAVCFIERCSEQRRGALGPPAAGLCLRPTCYPTVLGFEDEILEQTGDAVAVAVPGAVNQGFLSKARSWVKDPEFAVIARDPVSIFADKNAGINLYVTQKLNLLAVTVNPVSNYGISYDPAEMVCAIGTALNDLGYPLPVFDVVSGEKSAKGVSEMAVG